MAPERFSLVGAFTDECEYNQYASILKLENSPARVLADWFEGLHFSLTAGQRREGGECFVSAAAPRPAVISSNAEYVNSNGQLSIPIQTYHTPDTQINIHECLLDVLMNLCTCIFFKSCYDFQSRAQDTLCRSGE